ncbi:MAG: hypothetical protein HY706_03045 [Candidatus Hydrogenedentes bacterium]|nr:hypothetical protein [Candidatus Hydrogenedentota bacterium]
MNSGIALAGDRARFRKYWERLGFSRVSRRTKVLFAVLAIALALRVYTYVQARMFEAELAQFAQERARELQTHYSEERVPKVATDVTAYRRYLLFGETKGKVTVFLQVRDHTNRLSYHGIDYFYVRSDDGWHFTDSGTCDSREVQARARAAFGRVG